MKRFRDIIGQERIISHLTGVVKSGQAAHAYIFDGEKGMGKSTVAGIFAKALQCEEALENRENGEPCGKCHSCIMADSGSHPDIITLTPEKESSIGVDDIRSQIVNDVAVKPYNGPRKIYIIPNGNLMTEAAENALLKTLEEPPSYAHIMILSENKDKLLPTIVSRAVCLSMRAVESGDIASYIEKELGLSATETMSAVSFAQGNLGKAVMLAESEEFRELWESVMKVASGIRNMSDEEISLAAAEAAGDKEHKGRRDDFLTCLLLYFRDVLYIKAGGDEDKLIFPQEIRETGSAAAHYSFEAINRIIEEIKTARSRLKSNVSPEYTFEMLFIKMKSR